MTQMITILADRIAVTSNTAAACQVSSAFAVLISLWHSGVKADSIRCGAILPRRLRLHCKGNLSNQAYIVLHS